jgi:hypothetical protein
LFCIEANSLALKNPPGLASAGVADKFLSNENKTLWERAYVANKT